MSTTANSSCALNSEYPLLNAWIPVDICSRSFCEMMPSPSRSMVASSRDTMPSPSRSRAFMDLLKGTAEATFGGVWPARAEPFIPYRVETSFTLLCSRKIINTARSSTSTDVRGCAYRTCEASTHHSGASFLREHVRGVHASVNQRTTIRSSASRASRLAAAPTSLHAMSIEVMSATSTSGWYVSFSGSGSGHPIASRARS